MCSVECWLVVVVIVLFYSLLLVMLVCRKISGGWLLLCGWNLMVSLMLLMGI